MSAKQRVLYRRALVTFIVAMMLFPVLQIKNPEFTLHERAQAVIRPALLWDGFVKREWQPFLEQRFLNHIGSWRSFLIISYNEVKHRLFPTRPNESYINTNEFGYYPVDTIRRLNGDVLNRDAVKQHYQRSARRLRILQYLLVNHGVTLLVVTPPPKVRVYPEYAAPYLIQPAETVVSYAISYGDVLEESGVNVLNVQRIFLQAKATSPWPFFTATSFHWSYWAGCNATDKIMRKAEDLTGRPFYSVDCSEVAYEKSKWTDTDIAAILNIFSTDAIIGDAPFPKIIPAKIPLSTPPKIIIIGDSFSDQIVYALTQALPDTSWSPGWLVRYDRFTSRQTFGSASQVASQAPMERNIALHEILTKDLLVVEVSDGNISRHNVDGMEFGATRVLLEGLLRKRDAGIIDPINSLTSGWRFSEKKHWQTTGSTASLAIFPPTQSSPIQLALDIENIAPAHRKPRPLDILLDDKLVGQVMLPQGRGVLNLTLPGTSLWRDSIAGEISLRDISGESLNMQLHGIRLVAGDTPQTTTANLTKPSPMQKIVERATLRTINLISGEEPEDVLVAGMSGFESNGKENWRWSLGPATRIKFYIDPSWPVRARQVLLKSTFKNGVPILGQTVTIRLNGDDIRRFSTEEIGAHKQINVNMSLSAQKGVNVLEFVYQDWNHGKTNHGSNDPRQLAVAFMRLSLEAANK